MIYLTWVDHVWESVAMLEESIYIEQCEISWLMAILDDNKVL